MVQVTGSYHGSETRGDGTLGWASEALGVNRQGRKASHSAQADPAAWLTLKMTPIPPWFGNVTFWGWASPGHCQFAQRLSLRSSRGCNNIHMRDSFLFSASGPKPCKCSLHAEKMTGKTRVAEEGIDPICCLMLLSSYLPLPSPPPVLPRTAESCLTVVHRM